MSLMTTAHLLDRYGPLLTEPQLAEVLHTEPGTLRNSRSTLGIPVIRRGRTPLYHRGECTNKSRVSARLCRFCVHFFVHSCARRRPPLTCRARAAPVLCAKRLERHRQQILPALAEQWAALVDRALALDEDARLQVRQLVADTFERLVLYVRGLEPSDEAAAPIELMLVSRAGQARMLRFDRRTGALQVGADVGAVG